MKIDLHSHSHASPDGLITKANIESKLSTGKLDVIAITDHDRIDFALYMNKIHGEKIIVGEEITSSEGEIIGLYLSTTIEPGQTAQQTAQAIKDQGGLVYIPHPFEKVRKGVSLNTLNSIAELVDIVEVNNGRSFSRSAARNAVAWSLQNKVAMASSSDAHGPRNWGRVYSVIAEMPSAATLPELLKNGTLKNGINGIISYGYPKYARFKKRI